MEQLIFKNDCHLSVIFLIPTRFAVKNNKMTKLFF